MASRSAVYSQGPFGVTLVKVALQAEVDNAENVIEGVVEALISSSSAPLPPCPLLVAVPSQAGHYPVVVFQHGFMLQNSFYAQLLKHVASHGYMVVAPQMYIIAGSDATSEIEHAAAVINWLPENLTKSLPGYLAKPDFGKLVLCGHSRGGKVAFGVALGKAKISLKISGLAALDPVDGVSETVQTQPAIVSATGGEDSFRLGFPTLIVGTRLGSEKLGPLVPACAPLTFGHEAFYRNSSAPAYHFVSAEYGHMDFLDDSSPGLEGALSHCLCKSGPSREPLRSFAGGLLVAFLKAALFCETSQLHDVRAHPERAPIKLSTSDSK